VIVKPAGTVRLTEPSGCSAASLRKVAVNVTDEVAGTQVGRTSAVKASDGSAIAVGAARDVRSAPTRIAAARLERRIVGSPVPQITYGESGART
jgi:hypothetical protein